LQLGFVMKQNISVLGKLFLSTIRKYKPNLFLRNFNFTKTKVQKNIIPELRKATL
jgi:hypothetical protein